ncbi:MAG: 2'-5' RNA ligase family protein [Pseudomonadota bacterium]
MKQLLLPGIEPERKVFKRRSISHGLFLMVFPDNAVATRIAQLARQLRNKHGLSGLPLKTNRFHASLQGFGLHAMLPPHLVERAKAVGDRVKAAPFVITFDRVCSFKGTKRENFPFVLTGGDGVRSAKAFYEAINIQLNHFGFSGGARDRFTPHVTLLYDDLFVSEHSVEPISWSVRELVLVQSLRGLGRYIRLAKWPLRA